MLANTRKDHSTMNISLSFWKWVRSYVSGRTLQVKLPGVASSSGEVIAGVPRGGVLSPTLFNVFVNDIDDCCPPGVSISTCKYADDCIQYEPVPTGSDSHMQVVMGNLEAWAVRNKMEINAKKGQVDVDQFSEITRASGPGTN